MFDASGSCVGTLITDQSFSINAGEELNLTLVVSNLYLAPGRYYAGFSIGRGGKGSNRQDLDIVIGQPWFQVIPLRVRISFLIGIETGGISLSKGRSLRSIRELGTH